MQVVLLGTVAGPPPNIYRKGISSAVVVDGSVYLVDAGRSSLTQYVECGLKLANLAAVFLTHLHADHVGDYFNYFLSGGNGSQAVTDSVNNVTPVYGPGPAGGLPPTFGGGTSSTQNLADPTPGLLGLTDYASDAYAYSTNVFMRDSLIRETRALIEVHEIEIPDVGASFRDTAPQMDPFLVMQDSKVKVTAVLVPHGPTFPAFAYRFDTAYGSVTFSGDTTYTPNIPTLAHRSDLLVHEAINVQGFAGPPALVSHLLASHVEVQKVGAIAEAAEVRRLVLSHLGELTAPKIDVGRWTKWAQQGYHGRVQVGNDLDTFTIRSR